MNQRVHSYFLVYMLIACICMIDRSVLFVSAVCITPLAARISQRESMFVMLSVVISETKTLMMSDQSYSRVIIGGG